MHVSTSTPPNTFDAIIEQLQACRPRWVNTSVQNRIALLHRLRADTMRVAPQWVAAAVAAKQIPADAPTVAEEWLGGPFVLQRNLRLLTESLEQIARLGSPQLPGRLTARADGQVVAPVFPASRYDRLLYPGFKAEIRMEPGVSTDEVLAAQAHVYRSKGAGAVALVLGAGNVSSIGPTDVLYKLFVEDQVVLLKMNPVSAYLRPMLEQALAALIESGYVHIVEGGAAEGAYLCRHAGVDEIHITGSDVTHDAIVFGPGDEGATRKRERRPLLTKRMTSELGNVSPVIVVPGPWSRGDLQFQATNLASMLTNNAGFNCNTLRVIVQHAGWEQRRGLLQAIDGVLAKIPPRVAYYPGAKDRFTQFMAAHHRVIQGPVTSDDTLPWTVIADLDPTQADDICFTTEAFCGVCGEVGLAADAVAAYIDRAVAFVNGTLWGTLNAAIIVHPASLRDPDVAAAVERAVANLRYGTVAVNHWPAIGFGLVTTSWGAYPGHDIYDIGSGIGVVHNTYMLPHIQKAVVRGPFRVRPTPPWFATHRTAHRLAPKLTMFEYQPKLWQVPGILWNAVRG